MIEQNNPSGANAAPADLVGGTAAPTPRGATPKRLLWIGGSAVLALMVVGKIASDVSNGNFTDTVKQADRELGGTISKETVKAEFDAGKAMAVPKPQLTEAQMAAAINQPSSLSAADAAAIARGEPAPSASIKASSGAPAVGDPLSTTSVEKNSSTPEALYRNGRVAPAPVPSTSPSASPPNPFRSASTPVEAEKNRQASKEEEEMFSRRNSPLMVGSASGDVGRQAGGEMTPTQLEALQRGLAGGAAQPSGAATITDLIKKYQEASAAGTGSGAAGAGDKHSDWLRQQQKSAPPTTVFSQPAPQGIVVLPGSVINGVTRTTIRSDLPGDVIAMVTEDLYDSINGKTITIPKGSRLSGLASSDLRPGQERALTAFKQVFFPDGRSFDLQGTTGSDAEGAAGLYDEVERHYFRRYGAGLLLASVAYAVDRLNPKNPVVAVGNVAGQQQQTLSSFAGQTMADTTKSYIEQQSNIPDTLIIKAGHPFTIIVKQPLSLIPTNSRIK